MDLAIEVTLSEENKAMLRKYFQREADQEKVRCALETIASDIEDKHPVRALHILGHMDELISMYMYDVPEWENEALNYAAMNGQGLRDHLESALEADNEWESVDNGLNP